MPKNDEELETRVGPPVDCVAPTGSTAEKQTGEVTAAERTEQHCCHCGEDIRFIDGRWLDRETHSTCEAGKQCEDGELVAELTAIVREADQIFQRVGGSSRHWVRDCFLPILNREGLCVDLPRIFHRPKPKDA